jgi:hypothetical protein
VLHSGVWRLSETVRFSAGRVAGVKPNAWGGSDRTGAAGHSTASAKHKSMRLIPVRGACCSAVIVSPA